MDIDMYRSWERRENEAWMTGYFGASRGVLGACSALRYPRFLATDSRGRRRGVTGNERATFPSTR